MVVNYKHHFAKYKFYYYYFSSLHHRLLRTSIFAGIEILKYVNRFICNELYSGFICNELLYVMSCTVDLYVMSCTVQNEKIRVTHEKK